MSYLFLILIAIIWGSQYILNTFGLQELTPFGLMILRLFFGFITLSLLLLLLPSQRAQKMRLTPKLIGLFLLIGAVEAVIPFYLIGYGQGRVSSSITAILMGFIPMMTLVLEYLFKLRSRIKWREGLGLGLALIGLVILVSPTSETLQVDVLGLVAILGASFCFALALILMAKIPPEISPLQGTHFILMLYVLPLSLIWFVLNYQNLPTQRETWYSVILLGIFASGVIYPLYLTLVRREGASFTALSNYLVPVVGTLLGVLFLRELLTSNIFMALLLIIFSLGLIRRI